MGLQDRERVHAETVGQWRAWLADHADRGEGVWLVSWKKATGRPTMTYDEAVCEALAVGWVDSTAGTVDDQRSMLWFAPRKRGSGWSRPNKQRLEREGRLQERGRRLVEAAQADGSWALLDDVEDLVVPPYLAEALDALPSAREHWETFPRSVKRAQLVQLVQAKRPETRARRVERIVTEAAQGRRAYG